MAQSLAAELTGKFTHLIRVRDLAHSCDDRLVSDDVAYPEAGKTERLGERTHHDHALILLKEFCSRVLVRHEVTICLIDYYCRTALLSLLEDLLEHRVKPQHGGAAHGMSERLFLVGADYRVEVFDHAGVDVVQAHASDELADEAVRADAEKFRNIASKLKETDINRMTPVAALIKLQEIIDDISE